MTIDTDRELGVAIKICRLVGELPDRTSPDDNADMMLVTADELQAIITDELAALRARPATLTTISLSDPAVIIAGIRQFGLAPDGSDLRDLDAALSRLSQPAPGALTICEEVRLAADDLQRCAPHYEAPLERFALRLQQAWSPAQPAPVVGDGWQPIETARPGRWTPIDLWVQHSLRGGRREADCQLNSYDEWIDRGGNNLNWSFCEDDGLRITSQVTHWQPLPAAPDAGEGDGQS